MVNQDIKLTSAEISALWTTYLESSATLCFYKHFLEHLKDSKIKPLIKEAITLHENWIDRIKTIFEQEEFPIPKGFSDKDIDLTAPPLYTDLFALSFVYRGTQMVITYFANWLTKVARRDLYKFFENSLENTIALYEKSLTLMLEKGIYDRPPKMEYPESVEFIQQPSSLLKSWFGEDRPLNAMELGELFFTIERNCIGLILLMGLIQVSKDKEVKEYLLKGKRLSEKQIEAFNKVIRENEDFPTYPVTLEVTNSITSPFSERLMLFFISASNQIGLSTLSYALSVSLRKDLAVQYSLFIMEVMKYGNEGINLLVQRGWMEQPPQSVNRKKLYK